MADGVHLVWYIIHCAGHTDWTKAGTLLPVSCTVNRANHLQVVELHYIIII